MLHPIKMACGFLVMMVIFGVFVYITNERAAAAQFKRNHPIVSLLLILIGGYFITYMLRSLLVFMFGILLPVIGKFSIIDEIQPFQFDIFSHFRPFFPQTAKLQEQARQQSRNSWVEKITYGYFS